MRIVCWQTILMKFHTLFFVEYYCVSKVEVTPVFILFNNSNPY